MTINLPNPADYGAVRFPAITPLKRSDDVKSAFSKVFDDADSTEDDYAALFAAVSLGGRRNQAVARLRSLMKTVPHFEQKDIARVEKRGIEMSTNFDVASKASQERARSEGLVEAASGLTDKAHPSWDISDPLGDTMEEAIATLSKRWRLINLVGKVRFIRVSDPKALSPQDISVEPMTTSDFTRFHEDRVIYDEDEKKDVNPATAFVPLAKRLSGVGFAPPPMQLGDNFYNLYRGRKIDPQPGVCERLKTFIRHTVCKDRDDLFKFVWLWMAHLVQRPGEKPQTALVLRGQGGCGKSTFGLILEGLAAPYSMTIAEPEHVTGRFAGSHLATCILAVCTEALFAGDPKINGKLKSLVTSDMILAEAKGLQPIQMQSCLRLYFDSNNERVVPIDGNGSERRYLVMEVNDDHMNDNSYFEPIYKELQNGGLEALTYELMNYDPVEDGLRWEDVRIAPDTPERHKMRWHSMRPVERAIIQMIEDGCVTIKAGSGQTFRYKFEEGSVIRLPQAELRAHLSPTINQHTANDGDLRKLFSEIWGEIISTASGQEFLTIKSGRGKILCEEFVSSSDPQADEWHKVKRDAVRFFELPPVEVLRSVLNERYGRASLDD